MKKLLFTVVVALLQTVCFSQSNYEVANVYFKRAEKAMEKIDYKEALENFNKGEKLLDSIQKPSIAQRGILIHYELKNYKKAMEYAKKYFRLNYNKSSEEYGQMLNLYVDMGELLVKKEKEEKKRIAEKLAKQRELRRIDSLKKEWKKLSETFFVPFEYVGKFNNNNLALYKEKGKYGILDDTGKKVMPAKEYSYAIGNDGYFLFTDLKKNPTRVYCYNTKTKEGKFLPDISDFNSQSTTFGKVMLPRSNGKIVTYPNVSFESLIYDINNGEYIKLSDFKKVLKTLKKTDKIDKYSEKDRTVKINKKHYEFGGHLGGGVYRLTLSDYSIYGYLFSNAEEQKIVLSDDVLYLGFFDRGKIQGFREDGTIVWYNEFGEEVSEPRNEYSYTGNTKVEKLADGRYKFIKNGDVIMGNKKLEKVEDYIKRHTKK